MLLANCWGNLTKSWGVTWSLDNNYYCPSSFMLHTSEVSAENYKPVVVLKKVSFIVFYCAGQSKEFAASHARLLWG